MQEVTPPTQPGGPSVQVLLSVLVLTSGAVYFSPQALVARG